MNMNGLGNATRGTPIIFGSIPQLPRSVLSALLYLATPAKVYPATKSLYALVSCLHFAGMAAQTAASRLMLQMLYQLGIKD